MLRARLAVWKRIQLLRLRLALARSPIPPELRRQLLIAYREALEAVRLPGLLKLARARVRVS